MLLGGEAEDLPEELLSDLLTLTVLGHGHATEEQDRPGPT
jgi:hypothetical protein